MRQGLALASQWPTTAIKAQAKALPPRCEAGAGPPWWCVRSFAADTAVGSNWGGSKPVAVVDQGARSQVWGTRRSAEWGTGSQSTALPQHRNSSDRTHTGTAATAEAAAQARPEPRAVSVVPVLEILLQLFSCVRTPSQAHFDTEHQTQEQLRRRDIHQPVVIFILLPVRSFLNAERATLPMPERRCPANARQSTPPTRASLPSPSCEEASLQKTHTTSVLVYIQLLSQSIGQLRACRCPTRCQSSHKRTKQTLCAHVRRAPSTWTHYACRESEYSHVASALAELFSAFH